MFGLKLMKKRTFEELLSAHEKEKEAVFYRGRDRGMAEVIYLFKEKDKIYTGQVLIRDTPKIERCVFLDGFTLRYQGGTKVDLKKFYREEREKDLERWVREPK